MGPPPPGMAPPGMAPPGMAPPGADPAAAGPLGAPPAMPGVPGMDPSIDPRTYVAIAAQGQAAHQQQQGMAMMQAAQAQMQAVPPNPFDGMMEDSLPFGDIGGGAPPMGPPPPDALPFG